MSTKRIKGLFSDSSPPDVPPSVASEDTVADTEPPTATPSEPSATIPWPGSRYIIRCVESKKVLTFWGGVITFSDMAGYNSLGWEFVEQNGWLGLRDPVSHLYLNCIGHGSNRIAILGATNKNGYNFSVRHYMAGNYILLLLHDEKFQPLGLEVDHCNKERLNIGEGLKVIMWEFIRV